MLKKKQENKSKSTNSRTSDLRKSIDSGFKELDENDDKNENFVELQFC